MIQHATLRNTTDASESADISELGNEISAVKSTNPKRPKNRNLRMCFAVDVETTANLFKDCVHYLSERINLRSSRQGIFAQFVLGEVQMISLEECKKLWSEEKCVEAYICDQLSPYCYYYFQTWFLNYLFCDTCGRFTPDGIADVTKICRAKISNWNTFKQDFFQQCTVDRKQRRYKTFLCLCTSCKIPLREMITVIKPAELLLIEVKENLPVNDTFQLEVWNGSMFQFVSYSLVAARVSNNTELNIINGTKFIMYKLESIRDAGCLYQPNGQPEFNITEACNRHLFYDQANAIISLPNDHTIASCKSCLRKTFKDKHGEEAKDENNRITLLLDTQNSIDEVSFTKYLNKLSHEFRLCENNFYSEDINWHNIFLKNPLCIRKTIGYESFRYIFFPFAAHVKNKRHYYGFLFDWKKKLIWYLDFINEKKTVDQILHDWISIAIMFAMNQACHQGKVAKWSEWRMLSSSIESAESKISLCTVDNAGFYLLQCLKCIILNIKLPEKSRLFTKARNVVFHELVCGKMNVIHFPVSAADKNKQDDITISESDANDMYKTLENPATRQRFIEHLTGSVFYTKMMKEILCTNDLWQKAAMFRRHINFCSGKPCKMQKEPILWFSFVRATLTDNLSTKLCENLNTKFLIKYKPVRKNATETDNSLSTTDSFTVASPPNAILLRRHL